MRPLAVLLLFALLVALVSPSAPCRCAPGCACPCCAEAARATAAGSGPSEPGCHACARVPGEAPSSEPAPPGHERRAPAIAGTLPDAPALLPPAAASPLHPAPRRPLGRRAPRPRLRPPNA